jgi:hypothetical protein
MTKPSEADRAVQQLYETVRTEMGTRIADVLAGREVPKDDLTNTAKKILAAAGERAET